MKKILTICLLLNSFAALAQKFVVAVANQTNLYIQMPNTIDIAVEGYSCNALSFILNNGKIEKVNSLCRYAITPERIGVATMSILLKGTKMKIGQITFKVKDLPPPTAMVGSQNGGSIEKVKLENQVALTAVLLGFDFDVKYLIESYTVSVFRSGNPIFTTVCYSPKFPVGLQQNFKSLQKDDIVLFFGISCRLPSKKAIILQPIEFRIN